MSKTAPQPDLNPQRSANLIATPAGQAYQSYATDFVWVTKGDPYPMSEGNSIEPLLTGQEYFKKLAAAIGSAEKSIYMLGWQINWDVQLTPGVRLYDAFLNALTAKPNLKIYVLPWEGSSQVPTYVKETKQVFDSINTKLRSQRIFTTLAAANPDPSAGADMFFSHHQKQVVIDEKIAFIGGIDVAYGRNDDATYNLNATSRRGTGNDTYNGCLPHLAAISPANYVDALKVNQSDSVPTKSGTLIPNHSVIAAKKALREGKFQLPAGNAEINAATQPRMPWQDVHLKIEGPAVSDLTVNFVLRWNSVNSKPRLALPPGPSSYAKPGTCQIQMLRSASGKMVTSETNSVTKDEQARLHNKLTHNHIHHAIVSLIEKADHFIYIENQFFVSAFGTLRYGDNTPEASSRVAIESATAWSPNAGLTRIMPGDSKAPPANLVCTALGNKLRSVIMNMGNPAPDGKSSKFHIYITLPVHSEGMINDPSVMTQVHYTMQSLVFGSQSLINRTRRAILARKLFDKKDTDYLRAFNDANFEYESIPITDCWAYITLLNLRNHAQLGNRYVTEQIYIHTKMIIVDDRYAMVGSANINDRSLLGDRDSEIAVLMLDKQDALTDIGAIDGTQLTRKSARDLRMAVWTKIFGSAAGELADAIKRPAAQKSWEAIRQVANDNTNAYNAAFNFIPANGRSIWPVTPMPSDATFWNAERHESAASKLKNNKGFITLLPWLWTIGEYNNNDYHSALYVNNTTPPTDTSGQAKTAIAMNTPNAIDKNAKGVIG
jgi:phospholipase D1/2